MNRSGVWFRLKNGGVTALIAGLVKQSEMNKWALPLIAIAIFTSHGWPFFVRFGYAVAVGLVGAVIVGLYIRNRRSAAQAAGVEPTGLASVPDPSALR